MAGKTKTVEQKLTDYRKEMARKMDAVSQISSILSGFHEDDQVAICLTVSKFFELEINTDC